MLGLTLATNQQFIDAATDIVAQAIRQELYATDALKENKWRKFVAKAATIESRFRADLTDYFQSQKRDVLSRMKLYGYPFMPIASIDAILKFIQRTTMKDAARHRTKDLVDFWLFPRDEWMEKLTTIGGLYIKEAMDSTGADEMAGLLMGASFDVENPRVRQLVTERTNKFALSVTDETINKMRGMLSVGIGEGEGIPQLRNRVSELFDDMSRSRAETIARTETIWASNAGAEESWVQSGVVEGKEWFASPDACRYCLTMQGKTMPLGSAFFGQGDSLSVENARMVFDYEEIRHPPLHPKGRCTLIPVVKEIGAQKTAEEVRQEVIQASTEAELELGRLWNEALNWEKPLDMDYQAYVDKKAEMCSKIRDMRQDTIGKALREKLYYNNKPYKLNTDLSAATNSPAFNREARAALDEFSKLIDPQIYNNTPIKIKEYIGRSYFDISEKTLYIDKTNVSNELLHELGHFIENTNSEIKTKTQTFLAKRTKGLPPEKLGVNEQYIKDKFIDPYMGKIYASGDTEILSMGLEKFYYDAGRLAREDPEYFNNIYNWIRGH